MGIQVKTPIQISSSSLPKENTLNTCLIQNIDNVNIQQIQQQEEVKTADSVEIKHDSVYIGKKYSVSLKRDTAKEEVILELISKALSNMANENRNRISCDSQKQKLPEEKVEKSIPLSHYLSKIIKDINKYDIEMSDENRFREIHSIGFRVLLCSFFLVDRIFIKFPNFQLNPLNVHRLTAVCMMLVSKYSEDEPLDNAVWSKITNIPLNIINRYELSLVQILNYDFRVPEKLYVSILSKLGITSLFGDDEDHEMEDNFNSENKYEFSKRRRQ